MGIVLLSFFRDIPPVVWLSVFLIGGSALFFVALFSVKCFQDPNFCRSERHVEQMYQTKLEFMGTETRYLDAEIIEKETIEHSIPEPLSLEKGGKEVVRE